MTPRKEPEHPDIIYRPDLLPSRHRVMFSGMTLVAWGIWAYLFLPLISVLAWWAGVEMFANYMLDPDERTYFVTLTMYLIVIAGAGLVIFAWSRYNQLRFQGHDRRAHTPPVSQDMIQARFRVDAETLDQIHASKVMVLDLTADGRIHEVTTRVARKPLNGTDNPPKLCHGAGH
jgi:biofilm PGA synthesis protein PgaD